MQSEEGRPEISKKQIAQGGIIFKSDYGGNQKGKERQNTEKFRCEG